MTISANRYQVKMDLYPLETNSCGVFAAGAAHEFDNDGTVEIVKIFQCRELEMTLRYKLELLAKALA